MQKLGRVFLLGATFVIGFITFFASQSATTIAQNLKSSGFPEPLADLIASLPTWVFTWPTVCAIGISAALAFLWPQTAPLDETKSEIRHGGANADARTALAQGLDRALVRDLRSAMAGVRDVVLSPTWDPSRGRQELQKFTAAARALEGNEDVDRWVSSFVQATNEFMENIKEPDPIVARERMNFARRIASDFMERTVWVARHDSGRN